MPIGLNISGAKFGKLFVQRKAKRYISQWVDQIGPERVALLIKRGQSLQSVLTREQEAVFRGKAQKFAWAASLISDEEFKAMLPDWVHQVIAHTEKHGLKGEAWLAEQMKWLRGLFS